MQHDQAHLILSARAWWCVPGEPISWAFLDPFHVPLFEVDGLDEHGKKKRGLATRAMFQLGAAPLRVSAFFNSVDEQADDRDRPSAVVSAKREQSLAVRMTGTRGDVAPGADPGILVATPGRLALLEVAENREESQGWVDKMKKAAGAAYELAEDFAGTMASTVNNKGRYFDHGGQTQVPRVVEKACVTTDQVSGYEIAERKFRRPGYDKENRAARYLRIRFADTSRLDLGLPPTAQPDRVLALVRQR